MRKSPGQGMVEYAGSLALCALVVAMVWLGAQAAMAPVFEKLTDNAGEYYAADSGAGSDDSSVETMAGMGSEPDTSVSIDFYF